MTLIKVTTSRLIKRIVTGVVCWGWIGFVFIGCEKDYDLFDTRQTFVVGKPKIRFVNLHFNEQDLILNIGSDRLVKRLSYRELSAYEEAPDYLTTKTPYTVSDQDGKVLLQSTLSLTEGSNYTLYIVPSYSGVFTDYQSSSSPPSPNRYMASVDKKLAKGALILDPVSGSLGDRASVRQITFDPNRVLNSRASSPVFRIDQKEFLSELDFGSNGGVVSFIPPRSANAPDYSSSDSFINFGYAAAVPDDYRLYSERAGAATAVVNRIESGKALSLVANQAATFQSGKSYTVITNGTMGISNDVTFPLPVRGPLPLQSIPGEIFIVDDADGSARKLTPVTLGRMSTLTTILSFFDLNYLWKNANPISPLGLSIEGTVPTKINATYETQKFGNQTIEVVPVGSSRPTISSAPANLTPNGKYFVFHYVDKDNTAKTKIIQPDTVVKYGATVKINFANFSPDLEPLEVVNLTTREVLIPEIKFTELSKSIELPVNRSFLGDRAIEKVPKLGFVRPITKEIVFEIDLTPSDASGLSALLLDVGGQDNSGIIYTVILSGRYQSTTELTKFEKRIFALARADKPSNSKENIYDWRLEYALLP